MHDIDRTQLEAGWNAGPYGTGEYELDEYELDGNEFGMSPELYGETYDEAYDEVFSGGAGPLNEADEMELAADLLEITDEAELDQFIGNLFKKASGMIPQSVRKSLGGMLKGLAKKALPMAGAALGNLVMPGVGGALGGNLASTAGRMFGLELEGLSPEDQEFEVARQFVRTAAEAAKQAAQIPNGTPPQAAAQQALVVAAQKHAPGLVAGGFPAVRQMQPGTSRGKARSGRWIRRGRIIILLGI